MRSKQVEFLVRLRDAFTMAAEATNEYIEGLAPEEVQNEKLKQATVIKEGIFSILNFEPQEGAKIGQYEVSYKAHNPEDKWNQAYNILKQNSSTISSRYHGEGYVFSYWLYGQDKIYRQKSKQIIG